MCTSIKIENGRMIYMINIEFVFQTVNGTEIKDIYENFTDGTCNLIATEFKSPNCGWKPDSVNPECCNGCEGCVYTNNLIDMIGDI